MRSLLDKCRFLYRVWRYRHRTEPAEIRYVIDSLRHGQTAVDVGAHKGAFTYWMQRAVGISGSVLAFEPQPELSQYLQKMRSLLKLENVRVVPAGLSSKNATLQLSRPGSSPSPSATFNAPSEPNEKIESVDVEVYKLDDYVESIRARPIHFVKCDAEGHELEVFQGAAKILSEDRPILLFECEQRHQRENQVEDVFDYLKDLGYVGRCFAAGKLAPIEPAQLAEQSHESPAYVNNFCFVPKKAA